MKRKSNNSKNIFLLILLAFSISLKAQTFGDKAYYLIDSVVVEDLNRYDSTLLDSLLPMFHKETNKVDRLKYIQELSESLDNQMLWSSYNTLIKTEVNLIRPGIEDSETIKKLFYYEGMYLFNAAYLLQMKYSNLNLTMPKYDEAIQAFESCEDDTLVGVTLSEMGVLYYKYGNFESALEKFQASNIYLEAINADAGANSLSTNYKNIGQIYEDYEEFDLAIKYLRKAVKVALNSDEFIKAGYAYQSLSVVAYKKNNNSESIQYCDSANKLFEKVNHLRGLSVSLNAYGTLLYEQSIDNEVEPYFLKSIEISRSLYNNESLNMGLIAYGKYLTAENRLESAEKILLEAYEMSFNKKIFIDDHIGIYKNLSKLYVLKEDYKKAFYFQDIYYQKKDSIWSDKLKNDIIKHDINSEYEKKKEIDNLKTKQELELAEEQKQRTRLGMFTALIVAVIIGLFSIYIFNRLKLIRKQKKELDNAYEQLEESKKNELAVSNLKALQSQMNPHFIFNALNSVQDLVLLQDIRNSNKYLGKFSDLIRKILLSSKKQFISLEEEIEILSLYLDLEKLRFGEEFNTDFKCNISEAKQDQIMLPAMFIQPYIENAIKHGLFHKKGIKKLKVHFNLKENNLECIVEDNGVGQKKAEKFKMKSLHLHTGFSTEAINNRILLLNETLDKKIVLKIEDLFTDGEPAGTKITLLFPV